MLVDLLINAAKTRGTVMAVSDQTATLTYRRLRAFARALRDVVRRETGAEKVGILLPASSAFCGSLFGVLWARRAAVPLNFLLAPSELASIAELAGLDTIITIRHFADLVEKLPARGIFLDELPIKRMVFAAMLKPTPAPPEVDPDDTAVILFTSGTSGAPKGVELSYRNLHSNAVDCIATAGIQPHHRFLNCLPPFHVFGLTANVIVPVALGASVHCIPRFQPAEAVKSLKRHDISVIMAIPSMYGAMLRVKHQPDDVARQMFLAISGGEPLSDLLFENFRDRFGIELLQGYGLTETAPVCTLELPDARRRGSIGRPVRNVQIRIVDDEGRDLPVNTDGEIWIKGPNIMKGYYQQPEETRRVITKDGWFRTGDGGRIDGEGYVYITGRIKEMLIIGGENVYPREIEAVLERHEAVREAAVIGVPDTSRGEIPLAFVTLQEGAKADPVELRSFARQHLAGFKVPREVRIADDLPRSPIGKILKRKLPELL